MPTIPYIHFRGHCAEALAFYAEVFGGTELQLMRYADAPEMPETMQDPNRIIHGQVRLGSGLLMASDYPPGMDGDEQAAVSVMQGVVSVAAGHEVFARLREGGHVIQEFGPSFFSQGFGMVKDRYGTHWMISVMPDEDTETPPDPR
jgi:PhnB protein